MAEPFVLFELDDNNQDGVSPQLDSGEDIVVPEKKKIQAFLSNITAKNQFPIVEGLHSSSGYDAEGNPPPLVPPGVNGQANFLDDAVDNPTLVEVFNQTSNSGLLDLDQDPFRIKKGKQPGNADNGQELFRQLNRAGSNAPFAKRVSEVLEQNNNYHERNKFGVDGTRSFDENKTLTAQLQNVLGKHNNRKYPEASVADGNQEIDFNELKKLGMLMMLNASGELAIPDEPSSTEFLSTNAPGLVRLGQKVEFSRFRPKNIVARNNGPQLKDSSFVNTDGVLSYGSPNNYAVQFDSQFSGPSIVSATLLMLTLTGALNLVALAFTNEQRPLPNSGGTNEERYQRLGSYYPKQTTNGNPIINALTAGFRFNVIETRNSMIKCLDKGLRVFFGIDTGAGLAGTLTSAAAGLTGSRTGPLAKTHGYYNTVLRNLLRGIRELIEPVVNDGRAATREDATGGDVVQFASDLNPYNLIRRINDSPVLAFINMILYIGDTALDKESYGLNGITVFELIKESGGMNGSAYNPGVLQAKGRLNDGTLAMKGKSIKSMLLVPPSFVNSADRFGLTKLNQVHTLLASDSGTENIQDGRDGIRVSNPLDLNNNKRIKAEIVEKMEAYLEKDYMPFYFHDLRTNEIIAFHAFLENVSDNFNPEWNEVDGRVEKVPVYKGTNRTISLGFKVLATSEEDFDEMWFKINKLITLVYPQWTKGREVKFGNTKFTQPFSQLVSASPIIRLRLGDLFKTNYSKFAVARLFGISSDPNEFSLENSNQQQSPNDSSTLQRIAEQMQALRAEAASGFFTVGGEATLASNYTGPNTTPRVHYVRDPAVPGARRTVSINQRNRSSDELILHQNKPVRIIAERPNDEYVVTVINPEEGETGNFRVNKTSLRAYDVWIQRQARQNVLGETEADTNNQRTTTDEAFNSFISNANPIFKAFESTKGKGLAGVIGSLSLDFSEARWATNEYNSRAPMFFTINLEFKPIHDITPGIDHSGFMRAPVYNVGNLMGAVAEDNLQQYDANKNSFNASRTTLTLTGDRRQFSSLP